jgi:hypothetical protein
MDHVMGMKELKVGLEGLDRRYLIELISEICRKNKNIQPFLEHYFKPDDLKIFEEHKNRVREGFFPRRGYDLKLSLARKAINDFKKHESSNELLADLMFYYVECGVEFTNNYSYISEAFYTSVAGTYRSALDLMGKEGCLEKFKERAVKIVGDTKGIGWGFHDELLYNYNKYFS